MFKYCLSFSINANVRTLALHEGKFVELIKFLSCQFLSSEDGPVWHPAPSAKSRNLFESLRTF